MLGPLISTLASSTTLILAGMGGLCAERSGVINIALEGIILFGAFGATLGSYWLGTPMGLVFGLAFGMAMSGLHALACARFKVNQIVSGLAVNLLAFGMCRLMLKSIFGSSSNSPRVEGLPKMSLGADGAIDIPLFFLAALFVTFLIHYFLFRTHWGLRLSSCGENPQAASSLGINVNRMRFLGVLVSGACAGLAGAYLALDNHQFTDGMSGGRGFMAIAAYIAGGWKPWRTFAVCLLFGFAQSLEVFSQTLGVRLPIEFVQIFPYLFCVGLIAVTAARVRAPQALGGSNG